MDLLTTSIWKKVEWDDVGWGFDRYYCKHCDAKANTTVPNNTHGLDTLQLDTLPEEEWTAKHESWCRLK